MAEASTLAEIIDMLFSKITNEFGEEYSMMEVAGYCSDWMVKRDGSGSLSREYMRQLRNGKATNPTKRHLEAIAAFFEVDPGIFLDSEKSKQIQAELELAMALREAGVEQIALRALDLTPADRKKVMAKIQALLKQQGTKSGGTA